MSKSSDWGMPVRVRTEAHRKIRRIAMQYRLTTSDALEVITTAFERLPEADRLAAIRRDEIPEPKQPRSRRRATA